MNGLQQGKTAVDFSEEDNVKEALLEHRFSAEVLTCSISESIRLVVECLPLYSLAIILYLCLMGVPLIAFTDGRR